MVLNYVGIREEHLKLKDKHLFADMLILRLLIQLIEECCVQESDFLCPVQSLVFKLSSQLECCRQEGLLYGLSNSAIRFVVKVEATSPFSLIIN